MTPNKTKQDWSCRFFTDFINKTFFTDAATNKFSLDISHHLHFKSPALAGDIMLFRCVAPPPAGDIMVFHPEFERAGQKAGLQVWRVENMELVPVPESLYGGFYSGDAYMVLHSTKNRRGNLQYHLHYWQGTAIYVIILRVVCINIKIWCCTNLHWHNFYFYFFFTEVTVT